MHQIFVHPKKWMHQTAICLDFFNSQNLYNCLAITIAIFVFGAKGCGWIPWFLLVGWQGHSFFTYSSPSTCKIYTKSLFPLLPSPLKFASSSENEIHLNASCCFYMQNGRGLKKKAVVIQCTSYWFNFVEKVSCFLFFVLCYLHLPSLIFINMFFIPLQYNLYTSIKPIYGIKVCLSQKSIFLMVFFLIWTDFWFTKTLTSREVSVI